MIQANKLLSIMEILKVLYLKIKRLRLHWRMHNHPAFEHAKLMHHTLIPFNEHLATLSEKSATHQARQNVVTAARLDKRPIKTTGSLSGRISRGLSSYFRHHSTQPQLASKMRDSTHQHINMAITHARNGNSVSAHLQMELANHALHMAEHYMSNEEYQLFHRELEARFSGLEELVSRI